MACDLATAACRNEVEYALELGKKILPVYLENVELPRVLQMQIGSVQALFWYGYKTDTEFNNALFAVSMLDSCLTDEGKSKRGVKAKSAFSAEDSPKALPAKERTADIPSLSEDPHLEIEKVTARSAEDSAASHRPHEFLQRVGLIAVLLAATVLVVMVFVIASLPKQGAVVQKGPTKNAVSNTGVDTYDESSPVGEETSATDDDETELEPLVPDVPVQPVIDDYSWDDLKSLSQAITEAGDEEWLQIAKSYNLVDQDGTLQGDTKSITLADGTRARVRILGFRHDLLAGGGRAGITFEFGDVPNEYEMNPAWTNAGGWESSDMRERLNAGFINLLPDDLKPHVEEVQKLTNNVGKLEAGDAASTVTATSDKIWLLSLCEVYGTLSEQFDHIPARPEAYDGEGAQYQLYADQGVMAARYDFCSKPGKDSFWWLRSSNVEDERGFLYVSFDGKWSSISADCSFGVSPGFCI